MAKVTGPNAANATASKCNGKVTVWQHGKFNGKKGSFPLGAWDVNTFEGHGATNDDISSIEVPAGCRVELYEDGGFKGKKTTFPLGRFDSVAMENAGAKNDRASSLKVVDAGTGPEIPRTST